MTNEHTDPLPIVIAGATGDLGIRITQALVSAGADVRALLRDNAPLTDHEHLRALGATPITADPTDLTAMSTAIGEASCVVSALSGLREVIIDRQQVLLDAAVQAGVPRFIPSDYSADFTKTTPGHNRNFDLRREFAGRADDAPIQVTSVLNGAFLDMLAGEMPIIQPRLHRVIHWGDVDQPLDFTTKDDTAAYTASVALDHDTPRVLRIAGATVSARDIAAAVSQVTGEHYRTLRIGSVTTLAQLARVARRMAPQPGQVFPAWQAIQYMRDMFSGQAQLDPLDNDRYPGPKWTSLTGRLLDSPLAPPGRAAPPAKPSHPVTTGVER
jgi:nucleoside-diphosphate-sugar epimerase